MPVVLNTQITLDPNDQIAHIADWTGLVIGEDYVITGLFLQYDTRFEFHGFSDIALTRSPIGVPQSQTQVDATISTVPIPAVATPPAGYPYALNDRVRAGRLNHAFESSAAPTQPLANGGTAHLGRIWLDTSGGADTRLRMCRVPTASGGYNPSEWPELFSVNTNTGVVVLPPSVQLPGLGPALGDYVRKTGDTMSGNLTITKNYPELDLRANPGTAALVVGKRADTIRWYIQLPNETAETGGNAGSDFALNRCDDNGTYIGTPFIIHRRTGNASFTHDVNAASFSLAGRSFASRSDVHVGLYVPDGRLVALLGGSDPTNYFDNIVHMFRAANGTEDFTRIDTNGIRSYGSVWANGSISVDGDPGNIIATGAITGGGFTTLGHISTNTFGANSVSTYTLAVTDKAQAGYFSTGESTLTSHIGNMTTNNITAGILGVTGWMSVTGANPGNGIGISSNAIIHGGSDIRTDAALRALGVDGTYSIGLYRQGSAAVLNFYPSIYMQYNTADFNYAIINVNGAQLIMRPGPTNQVISVLGPVAGLGPYIDNSDRSLKQNIRDSAKGLAEILRLNVVEFERRPLRDGDSPTSTELGFVAQDVQEILPEAVHETIAGPIDDLKEVLGISSATITAALVNAVKELEARLSQLEGKT